MKVAKEECLILRADEVVLRVGGEYLAFPATGLIELLAPER